MRRNRFVVAYDIREKRRLHNVHKAMMGFGDPLQYSVFICDLSPKELVNLKTTLRELIRGGEDSVAFIDLGPVSGTSARRIGFMGRSAQLPSSAGPTIV